MVAKRLLIVVNALKFLISHRLPIAIAARNSGFDVHVAGADHGEGGFIKDHGLEVHPIAINRSSVGVPQEIRSLTALHRLYRRVRPDIVHHVTIKPVLYGTLAARVVGVPAVVNAISGLGFIFGDGGGAKARMRRLAVQQAYRRILGHSNMRIIFQNDDDRAFFHARRIGRSDQYRLIRGSGVDLQLFRPTPEPLEPAVVILPGRMLYDKGVVEFVEAARMLKARQCRARFVLVGPCDPDNPSSIPQDAILKWVRGGSVEWWGYCSDMDEVMRKAHIVCLPSCYREGVPKALIEAAASARPIVTTDMPGCRDVVSHGENGLLVPPRNSHAVADALALLLSSPGMRQEMGRKGRARAETMFSLQSTVTGHLRLYDELLSGVVA